ncbi:MAG TPA: TetR/AcrR family transcriptional regulator, partial [Bacteroidia bacterium]|nr:TetR/AcrR family transcriptional regulator [Bacteroidia bacterium]
NLALLNYYFKSKEKLFDRIMQENMKEFMQGVSGILNDEQTVLEEKIRLLVEYYLDMLIRNPDMPLFVLSHARRKGNKLNFREKFAESYFMKQIQQAIKAGKIEPIHPVNLMLNIVGLSIFPFIGRHIFQNEKGMTEEEFRILMQERKKMIPLWIESMLHQKKPGVTERK